MWTWICNCMHSCKQQLQKLVRLLSKLSTHGIKKHIDYFIEMIIHQNIIQIYSIFAPKCCTLGQDNKVFICMWLRESFKYKTIGKCESYDKPPTNVLVWVLAASMCELCNSSKLSANETVNFNFCYCHLQMLSHDTYEQDYSHHTFSILEENCSCV